jgi:ABC-type polar amino acid transport system ATPase subunit
VVRSRSAACGSTVKGRFRRRRSSDLRKKRGGIARALAADPPVLLMDERTAPLDPQRRDELNELLRGLLRQGRTLIASTHDEDFARETATRVVRMQDGIIT